MRPRHRTAALAALPALALAACGGSDSSPAAAGAAGGTVVISAPAEADVLLPPLVGTLQGKQVVDLLFDHLAEIGDSLNTVGDAGFRPQLAERWEWGQDSLSVAFHLNPRARWHDGKPVRASDVRFSFDLLRDPKVGSPHADQVADIDSVTVRDSLTAVAWFSRRGPERFFSIVYNVAVLPEHLLGALPRGELRGSSFARQPVGSGRFRFVRWDGGQRLEVEADTANYRGRPKLDRVVWTVAPDMNAAAGRVFTGEADFIERVLGADAVKRASESRGVKTVWYPALDYGYLLFNARQNGTDRPHPLFAERALRVALTHAVDRPSLVKSVFDSLGMVSIGPVTRAQSTADTTIRQLGFDRARAAALLDSLGWALPAGAGEKAVRTRGGKELAFTVIVPASSATRMQLAVPLQAQLAAAGVKTTIEALEPNAFVERLSKGNFDAALQAWRTDPSPSTVRQAWGSSGVDAGANYGRYASRTFDALVDSAATEFDVARSRALYRKAYQTIVDDAPALWLYEPRNLAASHARVRLTGVRADAWWAGLAEWSIPADARIPRDRAKPVAAR